MVQFRKIVKADSPELEEPEDEWICFDCGSTDSFRSSQDEWSLEWAVFCNMCGSENTGNYSEGWRSEGCPACEERGEGDENCPICDGYATTFPFMVTRYVEMKDKNARSN